MRRTCILPSVRGDTAAAARSSEIPMTTMPPKCPACSPAIDHVPGALATACAVCPACAVCASCARVEAKEVGAGHIGMLIGLLACGIKNYWVELTTLIV